ncbi:hypothetical protein [Pyrobaculum ferrireducens]|nr:hypothetical protein [Pyrobaculum ferrireducens]
MEEAKALANTGGVATVVFSSEVDEVDLDAQSLIYTARISIYRKA